MNGGRTKQTSWSVGISLGFHTLLVILAAQFNETRPTKPKPPEFTLTDVEIKTPEPEPPPEPPKVIEEPPPEVKPDPPKPPPPKVRKKVKPIRKPKPKAPPPAPVRNAPVVDDPIPDEPPPQMRFDQSNTVQSGNTGVRVKVGAQGGVPGGTGDANSKGKGSRAADSVVGDKNAQSWAPQSELFIQRLPDRINVPSLQCPNADELGLEGEVVMKVQIRRNGKIRSVKLIKGMGYGCDQVAIKALLRAKFKPAIATDGKPTDYEFRYVYEFTLSN